MESILKPLTDRLWNASFHWWDDIEGCGLCATALQRIQKEKPNFLHIVNAKPFRSAAHKKAVTETSFELLRKDAAKLSQLSTIRYWRIRRIAAKVVCLCEQRDAAAVLHAIDQLEPRLKKVTRDINANEDNAPQF